MDQSVSQRIKKIRNVYNLSQEDFGNKLNVSRSIISHLERTGTIPNYDVLQNLRTKFNIDLNWFVCGFGKMKVSENEIDMVHEQTVPYNQNNFYERLLQSKDETIKAKDNYIRQLEEQLAFMRDDIKKKEAG